MLDEKRNKYIEKWGNASRVGAFITDTLKIQHQRKKSHALPTINVFRDPQPVNRLSQDLLQKPADLTPGKRSR